MTPPPIMPPASRGSAAVAAEARAETAAMAHIETVSAPDRPLHIELRYDEGTSLCPLTGQPDLWTLTIAYRVAAGDPMLESKSLKFYLQRFRSRAIFAEHLAAEVCEAVMRACAPPECTVQVAKKSRGGISIVATCVREATR